MQFGEPITAAKCLPLFQRMKYQKDKEEEYGIVD